jgi:hypothetical protein
MDVGQDKKTFQIIHSLRFFPEKILIIEMLQDFAKNSTIIRLSIYI